MNARINLIKYTKKRVMSRVRDLIFIFPKRRTGQSSARLLTTLHKGFSPKDHVHVKTKETEILDTVQ